MQKNGDTILESKILIKTDREKSIVRESWKGAWEGSETDLKPFRFVVVHDWLDYKEHLVWYRIGYKACIICFLDWCQGLYDFGKVNLIYLEKPKYKSVAYVL